MLLEELSEKEVSAVLAEVGYTRKQLDSDLEHIKDWLKLQHHLPPSRLQESDSFLKMYLTGCKGSLEKVKRKIDTYYSMRNCTELCNIRNPLDPDYVNLKYLIYYAPSPKMINHERFIYFKLADVDQEKFDAFNFMRIMLNMADLILRYETISLRFSMLFDAKGITINHLAKINPVQVKDFLYYIFKAFPWRYGNIFVINTPEYLAVTLNTLVIPFLPRKLRSKFQITAKGFEEVSQYFDKSVLPRDFGGHLPSLKELHGLLVTVLNGLLSSSQYYISKFKFQWIISIGYVMKYSNNISDFWRNLEIERRDWYMNELSERCDESIRIIPDDPTNPYFGVPGSLKKLVVD